jgi:hypothetical protein
MSFFNDGENDASDEEYRRRQQVKSLIKLNVIMFSWSFWVEQ